MNTLADAFANEEYNEVAFTENGAVQYSSTSNSALDLFQMIGSVRAGMDKKKKDIYIPYQEFASAFGENKDLAIRILLWARDVRGGAGEREVVRRLLKSIENSHSEIILTLIPHLVELGRWDDIFVFENPVIKKAAFDYLKSEIDAGNSLAAKWAPRETSRKYKGLAKQICDHWGMSPRQYRKFIVKSTQVVEQDMSKKSWGNINYEHVPSLASIRYRRAFEKNDAVRYAEFNQKVESGEAKVNAAAVYPHQIVYNISKQGANAAVEKMWETLPNYIGDANILPMVDVSGSMSMYNNAGAENPIHIAIGLGLYLSMKNTGPMQDHYMTFSESPKMVKLKGSIGDRIQSMSTDGWGYNTNFMACFDSILDTATKYSVSQKDMPEYLVVLSDMEFDECEQTWGWGRSNNKQEFHKDAIKRKYEEAGYKPPVLVLWNLTPTKRSHVKYDDRGFVSISGFSPSIMKSVLAGDMDSINPYNMMLEVVGIDRYKWK